MSLTAFATCAPGLETILAAELEALGLPALRQARGAAVSGGVLFSAELADLARANRRLRTASRVLARVGMPFYARSFEELLARAARLPWDRFLTPTTPIALRVTCRASRLYHSDAVAERVVFAMAQRFGVDPILSSFDEDQGGEAQLIVVRLVDDECTISVDTSGAHLHRRGYRLATAKAPLRETLAAAMLLGAAWDPATPLLDPFCGSGTIAIEAALIAAGRAPNGARALPLSRWPCAAGVDLGAAEPASAPPPAQPHIVASDRDAGAIAAAQANAERAGVAGWIAFRQHSVSDIAPPPGRGWVVTNPPYGQRLGGADLRNLYARLGDVLRQRCSGWQAIILASDPALVRQTRLPLSTAWSSDNGGIAVSAFVGDVR
jgi:putative N6-adenine-specific DNA methylase